MPFALKRVEEACVSLKEAAALLKKDPRSESGKLNLISGERGNQINNFKIQLLNLYLTFYINFF